MKNPPVLQSAGIGFAARDEKVTASVAAAQQQDRVRNGFRNIVAQFNLISRQRQRQFNSGDGAEDSCVAGGASVLLGCCSGIAPVLRACWSLMHPSYNRCTSVVQPLYTPYPSLGHRCCSNGDFGILTVFPSSPGWYRLHRRGGSSHYMRGAGISVRGA